MAVKQEIFADGIGQIHYAGGMIRLDLMTLQPQGEGNAPVPEPHTRIIMTPQGILNAYLSMERLIDKLIEEGVLKRHET